MRFSLHRVVVGCALACALAAQASAATVQNAVSPGEDDSFDYTWTLACGAGERVISRWAVPVADGSPADFDAASIQTPWDYWAAGFVAPSAGGWGYQPAGDPAAGSYAPPVSRFASPACVLVFTFDAARRDARALALPGEIASLDLSLQQDMMQLQVLMSKRTQAMAMLTNLLTGGSSGNPMYDLLVLEARRQVDEIQGQLDQSLLNIRARQDQLDQLKAEQAYAQSGVDGIGPGGSGEFSLTCDLAPAAGPVCVGDADYLATTVPVPEPAALCLLAVGSGLGLLRRQNA